MNCRRRILIAFSLCVFVASVWADGRAFNNPASGEDLIRRVKDFYAARKRKDYQAACGFLSPEARIWYDKKEGEGDAWKVTGGKWEHWDTYFNGQSTFSDWQVAEHVVTAHVEETNDYYQLLDWRPWPMKWTWWFDETGKINGFLVESIKGEGSTGSRLKEFQQWAQEHHPEELRYLMPEGHIDPTGERPERWRKILIEWRKAAGLPEIKL